MQFICCRYFGQNCNQRCKCKNDAECRKNDGYCMCNDGWMGTHCDEVCPEGYIQKTPFSNAHFELCLKCQAKDFIFSILRLYGKFCMRTCSCASPQFVCHAAQGCKCKSDFVGNDCLTPKSLTSKLNQQFTFALCHLTVKTFIVISCF